MTNDKIFAQNKEDGKPLADRIRPSGFSDFVGQEKLVGPNSFLRKSIEEDSLHSMIFWGPPGVGKTTLAFIISKKTDCNFTKISAVTDGIKRLKEVISKADEDLEYYKKKTVLFIDEIHRWNKAQQDALLPFVENGTIILIGATTENPSFEINRALLSRSRVYVFESLKAEDLKILLDNVLADKEKGLGQKKIKMDEEARNYLVTISGGDARNLINNLEIVTRNLAGKKVTKDQIKEIIKNNPLAYDKNGDEHYHTVSAFIKSIRGSNPDAALYWLARMVEAGEDPKFIARRLLILASEDIGNAHSMALVVANAVFDAVSKIGYPECGINLAQGVVYLAKAPKSNKSYVGYKKAVAEVKESGSLPVPLHLRNAPTSLMASLGFGDDYIYPHDEDDAGQTYLPDKLKNKKFYQD
jgi:putative ATPase